MFTCRPGLEMMKSLASVFQWPSESHDRCHMAIPTCPRCLKIESDCHRYSLETNTKPCLKRHFPADHCVPAGWVPLDLALPGETQPSFQMGTLDRSKYDSVEVHHGETNWFMAHLLIETGRGILDRSIGDTQTRTSLQSPNLLWVTTS